MYVLFLYYTCVCESTFHLQLLIHCQLNNCFDSRTSDNAICAISTKNGEHKQHADNTNNSHFKSWLDQKYQLDVVSNPQMSLHTHTYMHI